ncbi:hypothetical protein [Cereibacter azotoformans]|uniref:hypothetical protein n=1 Tax=Cereibacter azotoformans TaxID=43057 RepID=UPI003CC8252E
MYLRELRERGYEGGIRILKDWLAEQHPAVPAPPIVQFETPPGRQAQADWTAIRRGRNKLSASHAGDQSSIRSTSRCPGATPCSASPGSAAASRTRSPQPSAVFRI